MRSFTRAKCPWQAAGTLLLLVAGCGAQYRPVVTPLTPTGPASQPTAYFIAVSSPSPTSAGLVTILDAFGDTVVAQATLSNGPFGFTLNSGGTEAYNLNGNSTTTSVASGAQGAFTLDSYAITVGTASGGGLQTQDVSSSTIPPLAYPFNAISTTSSLYLIEPYIDPTSLTSTSLAAGKTVAGAGYVAQLTSTSGTPSLQQEIEVAPNPVNFAGTSGGPRIYSISQGNTLTGGGPLATADACNTPSSVTTHGEVDSIEVTTNTNSKQIPVGICPVYGIESADFQRAFILNRGGNGGTAAGSTGSITVINAQSNLPDVIPATGLSTIPVGAGPVYADLYSPSSLLVTANYDSNTVSVINVPTDIYGNDGPNFGPAAPPITVGKGPVALTILRDGTKAYVANQLDGTVSVVNLSTFTVTKTITLPAVTPTASNPLGLFRPKSIASVYSTPAGKIYVSSPDSNALVAINTQTDTVAASILLPANAVSVQSSTQNVSSTATVNSIVNSNSSGFGIPCIASDTSTFCTHVAAVQ